MESIIESVKGIITECDGKTCAKNIHFSMTNGSASTGDTIWLSLSSFHVNTYHLFNRFHSSYSNSASVQKKREVTTDAVERGNIFLHKHRARQKRENLSKSRFFFRRCKEIWRIHDFRIWTRRFELKKDSGGN